MHPRLLAHAPSPAGPCSLALDAAHWALHAGRAQGPGSSFTPIPTSPTQIFVYSDSCSAAPYLVARTRAPPPSPLSSHLVPKPDPVRQAEVTAEQKEVLKAVLRAQQHATITPEIRRELFSSRSRGEAYLNLAGGEASMED